MATEATEPMSVLLAAVTAPAGALEAFTAAIERFCAEHGAEITVQPGPIDRLSLVVHLAMQGANRQLLAETAPIGAMVGYSYPDPERFGGSWWSYGEGIVTAHTDGGAVIEGAPSVIPASSIHDYDAIWQAREGDEVEWWCPSLFERMQAEGSGRRGRGKMTLGERGSHFPEPATICPGGMWHRTTIRGRLVNGRYGPWFQFHGAAYGYDEANHWEPGQPLTALSWRFPEE